MDLLLQRQPSVDGATLGHLLVDGAFECHTLEDVVRDGLKVPNQTAIPAGRYRVIVSFSQRFERPLPFLVDVPNFTGVRIHWGNTAADTDGCILVGQTQVRDDFIGSSRAAFDHLFPQIQDAFARGEAIWITLTQATPEALHA